jgi:enoyl-CoA hydratase
VSYETLEISREGAIAWISLNRPERRNAVNLRMENELEEALIEAQRDDDVRVIVLRGNGACFSSGHDLYEVAEAYKEGAGGRAKANIGRGDILQEIWHCRKPIISAVHGYVGPQAVGMVLCTDLIVAAEDASFNFAQVRAGGVPSLALIPLLLGEKKAKEWTLLGKALGAAEAERLGLVNAVVPLDHLEEQAREWASTLAAMPPSGVAASKTFINQIYESLGLWQFKALAMALKAAADESEEHKGFFRRIKEEGLRSAVQERDAPFAPEAAPAGD